MKDVMKEVLKDAFTLTVLVMIIVTMGWFVWESVMHPVWAI